MDQEDEATTRAFVDACVDAEPNRLGFDFREALCRHTAGNPLFVTELLRHLRESGQLVKDAQGEWVQSRPVDWAALPARVEGVIEERLQRLGKDGRETLSVASVEGENFTAEIVARLQASDEREMVRRLSGEMSKQHHLVEAMDVLRLGSKRLSRYRFHHSIFQRYLYDSLDKVELSYLHEDVGNALELFYADRLDDVAVELAWHFSCAGVDDKAARYHRRAGELAVSRYAHKEAIDHFTSALALTSESDTEARCELLLARETVYDWLGLRDEQARDLERLEKCAQAQVALRRAEHARLTGNYAAALAFVEQAVNAASAAGDQVSEARAYATWGRILLNQGQYQEAPEWLEMAASLGERVGSPAIVAQAIYDLGNAAYFGGKYEVALDHFTRALDSYRKLGDARGQVNALLMIGTVRGYRGDHTGAHQSLKRRSPSADPSAGATGRRTSSATLAPRSLTLAIFRLRGITTSRPWRFVGKCRIAKGSPSVWNHSAWCSCAWVIRRAPSSCFTRRSRSRKRSVIAAAWALRLPTSATRWQIAGHWTRQPRPLHGR